jgi:hypothetical protein
MWALLISREREKNPVKLSKRPHDLSLAIYNWSGTSRVGSSKRNIKRTALVGVVDRLDNKPHHTWAFLEAID